MNTVKLLITSVVVFLVACSDQDSVPPVAVSDQSAKTKMVSKTSVKDLSIKTDYPVTQITDQVYVIYGLNEPPNEKNQGFRNNLAFIVSKAGVVVIDAGPSVYIGEYLVKKIRSVTGKPVVAAFITHSHGDHWLGNSAIKQAFPDVIIYSHPKTKSLAEAGDGDRWVKILDGLTKGAVAGTPVVNPDRSVADGELLKFDDIELLVHHAGKAHTDSDLIIEVKDKGVVFTGDIVRSGVLGQMRDGTFAGNIAATDKLLGLKARHYLPGHGPAGGAEMVKQYRGYLSGLYSAVKQYYAEDLSDFEMKPKVIAALQDYQDWPLFEEVAGPNISQAYLEVEAAEF